MICPPADCGRAEALSGGEAMFTENKILVGKSEEEKVFIYPKMANRHGMIAGATGTGKTITLKVLAESFSDCGVPVFLADVKGDLAGMCLEGEDSENIRGRVEKLGLSELGFSLKKYPVNFFDIYGEKGMPLRTTVSEMGPLLLSRILDLNDTQSDILTVIFKIADDQDLLLIDTKDLKAMLQYVGENAKELSLTYGNISKQSLGAIIRAIIALEVEGAEFFFGEPALDIRDWLSTDNTGRGKIQILDCQKLINRPAMYATFLLWMMSELFETLPETGDAEKPKMVFFFDEAHILFDTAPRVLLEKVEQMVKLIRSKGVGIYFVTQSPKDIPDGVLAQLGNKIQHALHAYTPAEQKKAKAAAASFRENPEFDTYETLTNLGIGEALISVLDEEGIPTVVKKCKILPPQSRMGAITDAEREKEIKESLLYSKYEESFDRDSAYEFLQRKALTDAADAQKAREEADARKLQEKEAERQKKRTRSAVNQVAGSAAGTIGREIGNTLGKSVGGSFGKKLGGNVGASLGRGLMKTLFKM